MSYKVIKAFTDLTDNKYPYYVGDTFPRSGLAVSQKRIAELSGANNKIGMPLIKEVADNVNDDGTVSNSAKLVRQRTKKVARKVQNTK